MYCILINTMISEMCFIALRFRTFQTRDMACRIGLVLTFSSGEDRIPIAHKMFLSRAQVPEGRRVFSGLTVMQNLQMGAYTRRDGKEAIQNDYDMVFDLLPRLKERRNQPAGTLSGGEQQMLAMGRALMCKPKMLLLDEPSMGLSPLLVKEIFKIIRQVNRNGVTVLLVEQNAKMALEIANRAYVLETGKIKMEGEAHELANNIEVRKAYLGCE